MNTQKVREVEEKIVDLKGRWPAHSVSPSLRRELEALEEELEQVDKAGEAE